MWCVFTFVSTPVERPDREPRRVAARPEMRTEDFSPSPDSPRNSHGRICRGICHSAFWLFFFWVLFYMEFAFLYGIFFFPRFA